jgi:hypothetical protein
MPRQDKWEQFAEPAAGGDKWAQYAEPASTTTTTAAAAPVENPITAPLSKATGIGPRPGLKEALASPNFGEDTSDFTQAYRSVGNGKGLPTPPTFMGKAGQTAGVLLKNPATQALAGTIAPESIPSGPTDVTKEWQSINEAIGATKTSVRIPKSATTIEEAATMPARGLAKEGFNSKTLSKMTPFEQQAAIAPKWNAAGREIDKAAIEATAKNVTLNPSKSALEVASSIPNPRLREQAVQQLSDLMEQVGIRDASKATPLETLQLRRALQAGARFGPNGDLNSLGSIRAQLYRAVSGDLKNSIPGFAQLDQHFSDLHSAMKAVNSSAGSYAKAPPPSFMKLHGPLMRKLGTAAGIGGGAATLYDIYKHLSP